MLERLAARRLIQKYNAYPWPEEGNDYWGPDERRNLLAKLFNMTLDEFKKRPVEIEPPFYCKWDSTGRTDEIRYGFDVQYFY